MKIEDVLKLKEGGFSAQEIVQLAQMLKDDEPQTTTTEVKQEEVKQQSEAQPAKVEPEIDPVMEVLTQPVIEKKTAEPVVSTGNSDPMTDILNQMVALTKAIQGNQLKNTKLDIQEPQSAEDALASILM